MKENDQPFSTMYESYSLENFQGCSYRVEGLNKDPDMFAKLQPVCPACGFRVSKENLNKEN